MAVQKIPNSALEGLDPQALADAMNAQRRGCFAEVSDGDVLCNGRASEQIGYQVIKELEREAHGIATVKWAKVEVRRRLPGSTRESRVEVWGVKGTDLAPGQVVDAITRAGVATRVTITEVIDHMDGCDYAAVERQEG